MPLPVCPPCPPCPAESVVPVPSVSCLPPQIVHTHTPDTVRVLCLSEVNPECRTRPPLLKGLCRCPCVPPVTPCRSGGVVCVFLSVP